MAFPVYWACHPAFPAFHPAFPAASTAVVLRAGRGRLDLDRVLLVLAATQVALCFLGRLAPHRAGSGLPGH